MPTQHRMRFVRGQIAWMVGIVLALSLLDAVSYELFFVCSLIGLLIITELTAPINVTPDWRVRLRWLIALSLVGFALIIGRRILETVPPEVLPW